MEREQSIDRSIHWNFEGRGGYRMKWRQTLTITLARCPHDACDGNASAPTVWRSPQPLPRRPGQQQHGGSEEDYGRREAARWRRRRRTTTMMKMGAALAAHGQNGDVPSAADAAAAGFLCRTICCQRPSPCLPVHSFLFFLCH
jgi:hypothetical protein